jgi:N-acetyl-anhydromuramyl-L-alanine amidase AmpD
VIITDHFSAHDSSRLNHRPVYIIVHSTESPPSLDPDFTLRYLTYNLRRVSAHELVLPGHRVFRMVPDDRAAHHCESATVRIPGIDPIHANECTWGIEGHQVKGKPMPRQVLQDLTRRVVAACRRLDIPPDHVLGHREIDPGRKRDPHGVDMDALRADVHRHLSPATDDLLAAMIRQEDQAEAEGEGQAEGEEEETPCAT